MIVAAAVGDPNAGGGPGAGGPADDGGPLSFVLGSAASPNPFLAWLIASAGGLLLFLFLVRRSDRREREGVGSLALAAAYPGATPDMRGPVPAVGAAVAAAGRGRQKAEKPPKPPKAAKPEKPAKVDKQVTPELVVPVVAAAAVVPPPLKVRRSTNEPRSRRDRRNHPTIELVDATDADDAPLAANAAARAAMVAAATAKAAEGPQKFDGPPAKGVERLTINYRRVRVSEGPDEVNTRELGRLDRGDEVEVIGSYEGFLQVQAPDGLTGWIPRLAIV